MADRALPRRSSRVAVPLLAAVLLSACGGGAEEEPGLVSDVTVEDGDGMQRGQTLDLTHHFAHLLCGHPHVACNCLNFHILNLLGW